MDSAKCTWEAVLGATVAWIERWISLHRWHKGKVARFFNRPSKVDKHLVETLVFTLQSSI